MTKFNDILYNIAADNYGLITSNQARAEGVTNNELVQYAQRGRIERVGQGVYRLTQREPEPYDSYALALALVGPDAYLYGESVLAMLELCPTNPAYLYVATPHRIRRNLPDYLRIVSTPNAYANANYDGIPCQDITLAITASRTTVLPDRLHSALSRAHEEGYITQLEFAQLLNELGYLNRNQFQSCRYITRSHRNYMP